MVEKLVLYYRPGACALAPHILLNWLDIDYEAVNAPRDQSYRSINPTGAVPAIRFPDGGVLDQCSAILHYLAEASGRRDLLGGDDVRKRAEVSKWTAFFTGDFHPAFFPVFVADRYTTSTDRRVLESVKAAGIALVEKHLQTIEATLSTTDRFVGADPTIADAYAVPMLRWVVLMRADGLDPWPATKIFYQAICRDEGVLAAMRTHGIESA